MSGWDTYLQRMKPIRTTWVERAQETISRKALESPSSHQVYINDVEQTVAIISQTTFDEKRICSMPGETLLHGGLVKYKDHMWLITELDVEDEVYQRGTMRRCNHVLKWIGRDGTVREKWCVVEDGTKYLIGEKVTSLMTVGDSRIAVTVARDTDTLELGRGLRFIIDAAGVDQPAVYQITKANRFFDTTNDGGVFRFILNEVALTLNDNVAQQIADYNNWTPDKALDSDHTDSAFSVAEIVQAATEESEQPQDDNKKGWL